MPLGNNNLTDRILNISTNIDSSVISYDILTKDGSVILLQNCWPLSVSSISISFSVSISSTKLSSFLLFLLQYFS